MGHSSSIHHLPETTSGEATEGREGEDLPRISRAQFWVTYAVVVAIFFFGFFDTGPIWRHPWDIGALDSAIIWSYVPIPFLVAGCLLGSRRFSLRALFLDTLELTMLKYATTLGIALVLLEITPVPQVAPPPPPARGAAAAEPALVPTPIDPAMTGSVSGTVLDEQGRPVAGALAFVAAGLQDYVFAPPGEPVVITNDGHGATPRLAVARAGQPILARSTDGHLHTLVGTKGDDPLFNIPLLSAGQPTEIRVRDASGAVTLGCNVHPDEEKSRLVVLTHPFFAFSDGEGRFRLSGVPAGRLRIALVRESGSPAEATVELAAGGTSEIRLTTAR